MRHVFVCTTEYSDHWTRTIAKKKAQADAMSEEERAQDPRAPFPRSTPTATAASTADRPWAGGSTRSYQRRLQEAGHQRRGGQPERLHCPACLRLRRDGVSGRNLVPHSGHGGRGEDPRAASHRRQAGDGADPPAPESAGSGRCPGASARGSARCILRGTTWPKSTTIAPRTPTSNPQFRVLDKLRFHIFVCTDGKDFLRLRGRRLRRAARRPAQGAGHAAADVPGQDQHHAVPPAGHRGSGAGGAPGWHLVRRPEAGERAGVRRAADPERRGR